MTSTTALPPANAHPSGSISRTTEGTFGRLRRTLTSKFIGKNSRPTTPIAEEPPHATSIPPSTNYTSQDTGTLTTPYERFLSAVRKRSGGQPEFPPPEWFRPVAGGTSDEETNRDVGKDDTAIAASIPLPPTPAAPDATADEAPDAAGTQPEQPVEEKLPPPEPTFLARRIQTLLSSFPQLYPSTPPTPSGSASGPALVPPNLDGESKFISFLSSPSVMNGSLTRGRQSVWSILDRLRAVPKEFSATENIGEKEPAPEEPLEHSIRDDRSSVMLYGPLFPSADDEDTDVELARSEIVSVQEEDVEVPTPRVETQGGTQPQSVPQWRQSRMHVKKTTERVVWFPSDTKISLEVMWWGYRIYLPPPVLAMLDDQHVNASKQAALLTTALKWILDRVPLLAMPPQFRTAFKLIRMLVPYLGYIGSFVAWSWGAIKGFDKGNGVTLTATWLLPVALVPSTLEDMNIDEAIPFPA